ncbi:MAG: anthrone oxygenase family protein [Thermodesulfobacteriota bacterium]
MRSNVVRSSTVVVLALSLGAALAHLFALPNKIGLPLDEYFTVQQIYRGWFVVGLFEVGAIVLAALLVLGLRDDPRRLRLAGAGLLCLLAAHGLFWAFNFPANQATQSWTTVPPDWERLRWRWEWSHAARAVLQTAALALVVLSMLPALEPDEAPDERCAADEPEWQPRAGERPARVLRGGAHAARLDSHRLDGDRPRLRDRPLRRLPAHRRA